jgi:hypothetical protein
MKRLENTSPAAVGDFDFFLESMYESKEHYRVLKLFFLAAQRLPYAATRTLSAFIDAIVVALSVQERSNSMVAVYIEKLQVF